MRVAQLAFQTGFSKHPRGDKPNEMEQASFSFVVRLSWFKPVVEKRCRRMSQNALSLFSGEPKDTYCSQILIFQVKARGNSPRLSTLQTKHKLYPILFLFLLQTLVLVVGKEERKRQEMSRSSI